MKKIILALLTIFSAGSNASGQLNGLYGSALKEAVKTNYSPVNKSTDVKSFIESAFDRDLFTRNLLTGDYIPVTILPGEWWGTDDSQTDSDLFNVVPGNAEVTRLKKDYPPGNVTKTSFDNGIWKAGTGMIDGIKVFFYTPPKGYEGDFARAIFYMVCIYPNKRWQGLGVNFCSDGNYPGLHPWSFRQLWAWNEMDPVDTEEKTRHDKITSTQGNRNPFIANPEIAQHIWGDASDRPFSTTTETDPRPDPVVPIKPTYRLSDNSINLTSPHIPADAEWSVNGSPVTEKQISPTQLGVGIHEFRFRNSTTRGKILIEITK